jgi:hypothetical protein
MLAVLDPAGLQPEAATVYVTVYVPGVLEESVITPVLELIVKPAVEVYVPPDVKPVTGIGVGFVLFAHTGDVYENPVVGATAGVTVIVTEGLVVLTHVGDKVVSI